MFSASSNGAEASSILYSLIQTAKVNRLDPYEYLRILFNKLPTARSLQDYEALLPHTILVKPPPDS